MIRSTILVNRFSKIESEKGEVASEEFAKTLRQSVKKNDFGDLESMLTDQANILNSIFNRAALHAEANLGEYMDASKLYINMALKAQNQCRSTIQTLHEIKNPKHVTIANQANIANQQLVNNGESITHAENSESSKANELMDLSDKTITLETANQPNQTIKVVK